MDKNSTNTLRKYGYDILINNFEPLFRDILKNEVLLLNFGTKKWIEGIPKGVKDNLKEEKQINIENINIDDFFEEIYFWGLKEISIYSNNYAYLDNFILKIGKEKFIEVMDDLNELRIKVAHRKTFTKIDLEQIIELIKEFFSGELSKDLLKYIEREEYKNAKEIPDNYHLKIQKYYCKNNLPFEEYDLAGGFVGRKKEISSIKKLL